MGHALGDSSTYVRFYMTDYNDIDFQEIVFGSEPQRDLIHLMGRLLRHGDAPKHVTEEQRADVNKDVTGTLALGVETSPVSLTTRPYSNALPPKFLLISFVWNAIAGGI